MDNGYSPTILQGQHTNDDEILAKTPLDPKALGGDSSVIIMELLQRFKVRSGSLSCGAREVRSPCAWRGGARPGSRVTAGD